LQGVNSHIIQRQRHSLSNTMQQMEVDSSPMTPTEYMEEDRSPVPDSNAMDVSEADENENDDLASVAALIDQLKHEDVQLRVNACQKLTVIAAALGPERARDELIPFLDGNDLFLAIFIFG
jgi:serine/threonine-protein phosphatase 2A regulatory subunit A